MALGRKDFKITKLCDDNFHVRKYNNKPGIPCKKLDGLIKEDHPAFD